MDSTTANARLLEAERLTMQARESGDQAHALAAVTLLEGVAAEQVKVAPFAAFSSVIHSLRIRQEFHIDFAPVFLRAVSLFEASTLIPSQKKLHRRAFAALAKSEKDPDVSSWLAAADLAMTQANFTTLGHP